VKKIIRTMRKEIRSCSTPSYGTARRVSSRADYKAYCRLYLDVFGRTFNRRLALWLLKKEIHNRSYVWFAEDGNIAGIYALLQREDRRVTPDVSFKLLCNVAMAKEYQGQGLSKYLLQSALETAYNLGCSEVILDVAVGNQKAINLYTSLGFEFVDEQPSE
jgi:ribosomal protein S18 acetylase RimI-like enzyme